MNQNLNSVTIFASKVDPNQEGSTKNVPLWIVAAIGWTGALCGVTELATNCAVRAKCSQVLLNTLNENSVSNVAFLVCGIFSWLFVFFKELCDQMH